LTKGEWVVNDRRKEIDGVDDGEVVAQAKYASVIAGRDPNQKIGMTGQLEMSQNCFEVRRTQLSGSTRGLATGGQADQLVATRIVGFSHQYAAYRCGRRRVQRLRGLRFYRRRAACKLRSRRGAR